MKYRSEIQNSPLRRRRQHKQKKLKKTSLNNNDITLDIHGKKSEQRSRMLNIFIV